MSAINYEKETVEKMIRLYCAKKHKSRDNKLCNECAAINEYAAQRLTHCPFGDEKAACADCKVHCYKPEMRDKIRQIMRFSGPRMLIYYPLDFLRHITKDRR